jgi:4-amino-4-deoxy-L-arabinose transferase-like glycosyltransferase
MTSLNSNTRSGTEPNGPRLRDAAVLVLLIGLFISLFLGSRPLSVPDEGRYVEIPREMVVTGNWLTPRLNGIKYFEKPPLFYWFEACLIKLFGLSEWSVRIGPAVFALFGCLTVYYAGARLFGQRTGMLSAGVLATSILYFALSRLISLDMPVSVLLTAALLSFLLGTREPEGSTRRLFFLVFYAFAALATMTKGLIGIVFPGMIIFTWMLIMNEWRILRSMHLFSGPALFLLIAAPWHLLAGRANPEFFDFYFVREHFQRYLTQVHHHYKPAWFYIPILIGGMFPWSVFLIQAVRHAVPPNSWKERKNHTSEIFLLLWALLIFLFFSASSSKLIPYLLPVLPPLALLIGKYFADAWELTASWGFRIGSIAYSAISMVFAVGLFLLHRYVPEVGTTGMTITLWTVALWLLLGSISVWTSRGKNAVNRTFVYIVAAFSLFLIAGSAVAPSLDTKSLKPLALTLKPVLRPDDEIMNYRNYYQDLPVYLERRITLVEWRGELEFGMTVEDASGWMIGETELWKRWQGPRRVFLAAGKKDAAALLKTPGKTFFLIAENKNTVILSNSEARP